MNIGDGFLARPSLPTPPGADGTIGCQGRAVRPGWLGTLDATAIKVHVDARILVVVWRTFPQEILDTALSQLPQET